MEKKCKNCFKPMKLRNGQYGNFWACTGYPVCKTTEKDLTVEKETRPEGWSKTAEIIGAKTDFVEPIKVSKDAMQDFIDVLTSIKAQNTTILGQNDEILNILNREMPAG